MIKARLAVLKISTWHDTIFRGEITMGFLDSLKALFTGGGSAQDTSGYWIYARCRRCGELIKTRLDLRNSLSSADEGGYMVNKTLMGQGHCFERIEVTLKFDDNRRLVGQDITRGEFITAAEFEAARNLTKST
jgi:hypothetical protein